jgi:translation initiation factor IF-2
MSEISVQKLAETIGAPVETLLRQMKEAGINVKGADDSITDRQKLDLLEHIRQATGSSSDGKITLKKRSNNELKLGGSAGKSGRTVNVEVRRKKTIVRNDLNKPAPAPEAPAPEVVEAAPVAPTPPPVAPTPPVAEAPSGSSRTEELGKQLEAERQARESAILEQRRQQADKQAKKVQKAADAAEAKAAPAVETPATPAPVEQSAPVAKAPEAPKQAPAAKPAEAAAPKAPTQEAKKPEPVATKPAEPAQQEEKKSEEAPKPTLMVNKTKPEDKVDAAGLPIEPKARRAAVAAKARAEAAAIFKKRPSRAKVVPPPAPAAPAKAAEPAAKAAPAAKPAEAAKAAPAADKGKKKPFQGRGGPSTPLHIKNNGGQNNGRRGDDRRKGGKGKRGNQRRTATVDQSNEHGFEMPTAPVVREVEIPETIIVSELAQKMAVKGGDIIRTMMGMGVMATINQALDQDTAILIVEEMGHKGVPGKAVDEESQVADLIENIGDYELHSRPPVVTIMGHVDHGKTSLLDYIRTTRVASGEAGGITQHIGAYHVETPNGIVSFLDTPGHAAFTSMRARGAKATDVVILVVAADDGVMPQTREAIEHTRSAGVPMIVAINKIDKPEADPERVKTELSNFGVIAEEWGGEDIFVNVSAKTGQGVTELLDSILLVSEVLELKARTEGPAQGLVIESRLEKGRGAVSTVLVQQGTLKRGDIVLAGSEYGRIRAMLDEDGKSINEAGPSIPVEILGLSGTASSGEPVMVMENERKAKEISTMRHNKERETRFAAQQAAKLDEMFSKMRDGEKSTLNVLLKADVHGSLEAIKQSLAGISTDEVAVKMIGSGVGGISETDVALAQASEAIMIGFNVRADASARRLASEAGIEIRYYSIIYELIDDVRDALSGLLKPELREEMTGLAEVRGVFKGSGFGNIAGCLVTEGVVKRGNPIRVLRDNVVIYEGELESLRRHQDDVSEVRMGTECGIGVKNYDDVRAGDQIEIYTRTVIQRTLDK